MDYTDYRSWLAPGELDSMWWTTEGSKNAALIGKAKDRLARAEKACGGPVRVRYWEGNGWAISSDPYAVPPKWVGDRDFKAWIPDERKVEETKGVDANVQHK